MKLMKSTRSQWRTARLHLVLWLSLLSLLQVSLGTANIHTLYMNSYKNCNHEFAVLPDVMYQVKTDASPRTATRTVRSCELTFTSEDIDGHLCLAQDYPKLKIADKNVELVATDGINDNGGNHIVTVPYGGHWTEMEVCTKSRYIALNLKVNAQDGSVDISHLTINLKVMDIKSSRRRVDMDYEYCERTYALDHSDISVYNRKRPEDRRQAEGIELKKRCSLTFRKKKTTNDRNICLAYIPQGKPDCSSDWTLYVLKEKNILEKDNILYQFDCDKTGEKPLQTLTWCAPNRTDQITLLHWRKSKQRVWSNETKLERPEQYRLKVLDFHGDARELLNHIQAQLAAQTGNKAASFSMWWLLLIVGIVILVVIAGFAYCSRRKRCGRKKSRGSEATDRESSIARREEDEEEEEEEE